MWRHVFGQSAPSVDAAAGPVPQQQCVTVTFGFDETQQRHTNVRKLKVVDANKEGGDSRDRTGLTQDSSGLSIFSREASKCIEQSDFQSQFKSNHYDFWDQILRLTGLPQWLLVVLIYGFRCCISGFKFHFVKVLWHVARLNALLGRGFPMAS